MRIDVLVVGSGPAGLSTALSLKHEAPELEVIVVDALPTKVTGSNAIAIYPATMEALRSVGAHSAIDDYGYHAGAATFFNRSDVAIKADYDPLRSRTVFPYIILLSQTSTELLLTKQAEEAGVKFLWGYKAASLNDGEKGLMVTFENGESITADYVVGADGSKSTMRNLADIPFCEPHLFGRFKPIDPRETNEGSASLIIADVTLQHSEPIPCQLMTAFDKSGFNLLAPVAVVNGTSRQQTSTDPEDAVYRVVFKVQRGEERRARDRSDIAYIRDHVAEHFTFLGGKNLSGTGLGPNSIVKWSILTSSLV